MKSFVFRAGIFGTGADKSPSERNESSLLFSFAPSCRTCFALHAATFDVIFRTSKRYATTDSPDINNFIVVIHAKPARRNVRARVKLLLKFLFLFQNLLHIAELVEVAGRFLLNDLYWFAFGGFLFNDDWFLFLAQLGSMVGIFDGVWVAVGADGLIGDEMSRLYCIAVRF